MIYEHLGISDPIRQGDIFVGLPRVEVSLTDISVVDDAGAISVMQWKDVADAGEPVTAVLAIRPVTAIVVTQDCDNVHGQDITLCEVRDFRQVEGKAKDAKKPKSWVNILTQHARLNLKWFYLPPSDEMGFTDKQAVDFTVTIRVPRPDLENLREFRKGRLNEIADEHFRERISEFFRRYPYDEWYSLDTEELKEYRKRYPEATPFSWQAERSASGNG